MDKKLRGYTRRFTLLHALTYWIVGMIFYQISGYEEAMNTMEAFELFRPLDNGLMVIVVFLGQIIRGAILALLIYPFYSIYMNKQQGWLYIFLLLWGLTALGSLVFIPNLLQDITNISLTEFIESIKIGIPEITLQMLVFSWLFFKWEKRKIKKIESQNTV